MPRGDGARNSEGGKPVRSRRPLRPRDRPTTPPLSSGIPAPVQRRKAICQPRAGDDTARATGPLPASGAGTEGHTSRIRPASRREGGKGRKPSPLCHLTHPPTERLWIVRSVPSWSLLLEHGRRPGRKGSRTSRVGRPTTPPTPRARSKTLSEKTSPTPNP